MRSYENVFVMAPTLDAEAFQSEVDSLKKLLGTLGATITTEKEWGRRRLAYPIRDHSEGIYHILRFDAEPEALPELDRWFKLNENVLRALVIVDEGGPLDHVGQVSESEERGHRDSRDRRGDRPGGRYDSSDSGDSRHGGGSGRSSAAGSERSRAPVGPAVAESDPESDDAGGEDTDE